MELDDAVQKRISVKSYLNKDVPNEVLGLILEAGSLAPSAGNLQNWKFLIVRDENIRAEISAAARSQNWMNQAPVFIVVCNDQKIITEMYGDRGKLYSTQDCAIAAQNIMLKAVDMGLATCWVGSFDTEAVRRILKIPDNVVPEMIITLGYSNEEVHQPDRESVSKITFFESWGNKSDEKTLFPLGQTAEKYIKAVSKKAEEKRQSLFSKFKAKFKKD